MSTSSPLGEGWIEGLTRPKRWCWMRKQASIGTILGALIGLLLVPRILMGQDGTAREQNADNVHSTAGVQEAPHTVNEDKGRRLQEAYRAYGRWPANSPQFRRWFGRMSAAQLDYPRQYLLQVERSIAGRGENAGIGTTQELDVSAEIIEDVFMPRSAS